MKEIMDTNLEGMNFDPNLMTIPVISDKVVEEYRSCLQRNSFYWL